MALYHSKDFTVDTISFLSLLFLNFLEWKDYFQHNIHSLKMLLLLQPRTWETGIFFLLSTDTYLVQPFEFLGFISGFPQLFLPTKNTFI